MRKTIKITRCVSILKKKLVQFVSYKCFAHILCVLHFFPLFEISHPNSMSVYIILEHVFVIIVLNNDVNRFK